VSSVALNLAEEKQRKPRAVKEREVTEADLSEQQKAILQARGESTPYVDPSRSVERGELHVILNEAISELRDKECQLLLREVYFRGEKAADVARCMGITPNAANVKKSRNLEQLERILREKWPDYPWDDL
jgi:DNA-directed RNA polymerase specialized sigma24 family protein